MNRQLMHLDRRPARGPNAPFADKFMASIHDEEEDETPGNPLWNECIDPRWLLAPTPTSTGAIHEPITSSSIGCKEVPWDIHTDLGVSGFVDDTSSATLQNVDVAMCFSDVNFDVNMADEVGPQRPYSGENQVNQYLLSLEAVNASHGQTSDIDVKKGENTCPLCKRVFVNGAAAVRKHIKNIHIQKGNLKGRVIQANPGRTKRKAIPDQRAPFSRRDKKNESTALPTSCPPENATKEELRELCLELKALQQGVSALDAEVKLVRRQQNDIAFLFNKPRSTFSSIVQTNNYYFILQCGEREFLLQTPECQVHFEGCQIHFEGCPKEERGKPGTPITIRLMGGHWEFSKTSKNLDMQSRTLTLRLKITFTQ